MILLNPREESTYIEVTPLYDLCAVGTARVSQPTGTFHAFSRGLLHLGRGLSKRAVNKKRWQTAALCQRESKQLDLAAAFTEAAGSKQF